MENTEATYVELTTYNGLPIYAPADLWAVLSSDDSYPYVQTADRVAAMAGAVRAEITRAMHEDRGPETVRVEARVPTQRCTLATLAVRMELDGDRIWLVVDSPLPETSSQRRARERAEELATHRARAAAREAASAPAAPVPTPVAIAPAPPPAPLAPPPAAPESDGPRCVQVRGTRDDLSVAFYGWNPPIEWSDATLGALLGKPSRVLPTGWESGVLIWRAPRATKAEVKARLRAAGLTVIAEKSNGYEWLKAA